MHHRKSDISRSVLITGASSGIGRATALAFAHQKYRLFLAARRTENLATVASACRAAGSPEVLIQSCDLAVPGQGASVVQSALASLGELDCLVLNAGYGLVERAANTTPEAMRRMMQVNFHSAYESIHAVLPYFLPRRRGHLVLVSSVIGRKGMPFSSAYCATKFAQVGLAESLWGELLDTGIKVSLICPGFTETEFHSVASEGREPGLRFKGQPASRVAQAILKAVEANRQFVHLTFSGRILIFANRVSFRLASWMTYYVARLRHQDRVSH